LPGEWEGINHRRPKIYRDEEKSREEHRGGGGFLEKGEKGFKREPVYPRRSFWKLPVSDSECWQKKNYRKGTDTPTWTSVIASVDCE